MVSIPDASVASAASASSNARALEPYDRAMQTMGMAIVNEITRVATDAGTNATINLGRFLNRSNDKGPYVLALKDLVSALQAKGYNVKFENDLEEDHTSRLLKDPKSLFDWSLHTHRLKIDWKTPQ